MAVRHPRGKVILIRCLSCKAARALSLFSSASLPKVKPLNINARPIVFLGGIFTPAQIDFILAQSMGVIQNAADALQKNLIKGLSSHHNSIIVLNLPFVGSYPRLFRLPVFPSTRETILSNVPVEGRSFVLVKAIKSISRLISTFRGLRYIAPGNESVVLIYSAHLPFVASVLLYRFFICKIKVCLILPDLPEYMDEGGILYRAAKSIESRIFYMLVRKIDGFVLLTRFMADRLNLENHRYVVMEGIADCPDESPRLPDDDPEAPRRIFLYTGTLAARYGIMDLVEGFRQVSNPDAELWICGDGDSREQISLAAKQDARIRYLGQVSRDEARRLQEEASILVNPRRPVGDFTRYSFPSKTLEYMASGTPVLMHQLAGVPDEYLPFFFRPSSPDAAGLALAMQELANCDGRKLRAMGAAAREFVLEQKNAVFQSRKIMTFIDSLRR